jgi:uncharacterized protein (DUF1810 family)
MPADASPHTGATYNLQRFLTAHEGDYARAAAELVAGRKETHWIWYVFPQMKGLGRSDTAEFYGIASLDEAKAYLAHPVLGPRLEEATRMVLGHAGQRSLHDILGTPDDMKFRSCMTLFAKAAGEGSIYAAALRTMCGGKPCERTLELLGR